MNKQTFFATAIILIATLFSANNLSAQWSQNTTSIFTTDFTKRVGIGTSNTTSAKLQFDNAAGNKITLYDHGNNVAYGFGISASNLCAYVPVGSRFSIRTNNSNGTEKFLVNSDGTVGVGSRIYLGMTGTEGGGWSHLHFKNGTTTAGGIVRASTGNSDAGNAPLRLEAKYVEAVTNGTLRMSVNDGGLKIWPQNNSNEGGEIQLAGAANNPIWAMDSYNDRLRFISSGVEKMTMLQNGNIGVGTASAGVKFQVNGGNGISIGIGDGNTGEGIGSKRTVAGNQWGLDFYTNGTNRMSITNSGKVGIGISEPEVMPGNYKLYVTDGIMTEKVKVAVKYSADWADYVFADDYKLRSLAEVESFVKENKHLPGVPSAEEVQKSGIDVATMDAKLLEKIEELTLYMIDMKKENEALKARISNLESKK